jgi:ligand-binding SRPBCC domain-containing protein
MGFYQYKREQFFKHPISDLWNFISRPENLKKITPDYMGFDIISKEQLNEMYEGMIIAYKVSPILGIKTTWVTEITHIRDQKYFVDEQRVGPYKLWHHQHFLEEKEKGTLMSDIISYQPPFGIIGSLANKIMVRRKLKEIFDYREKVLRQIFP